MLHGDLPVGDGDPTAMLELVRLAQATRVAALRSRRRLVLENLADLFVVQTLTFQTSLRLLPDQP